MLMLSVNMLSVNILNDMNVVAPNIEGSEPSVIKLLTSVIDEFLW